MADYNFRGYDIGKTLLECVFERPIKGSPTHIINSDNFPSELDFIDFIRFYLISNELGITNKDDIEKLVCGDDNLI